MERAAVSRGAQCMAGGPRHLWWGDIPRFWLDLIVLLEKWSLATGGLQIF